MLPCMNAADDSPEWEPTKDEARRARFTSIVSSTALVSNLCYILGFLWMSWPIAALQTAVFIPGYVLPLLLISRSRIRWATITLIFTGVLNLFTGPLLIFGADAGVHFFLLAIPQFAFLLFDHRDSRIALALTITALVGFVGIEATSHSSAAPFPVPATPALLLSLRTGSILTSIAFSIGIFILFQRDLQQTHAQLEAEHERSERLLLNVLPGAIATRLKNHPGTIADNHQQATVLFSDIVGFTKLSATTSPEALVELLNAYFSAYDALAERHGVEKIKTIGDAYMAAAGIPLPRPDHVRATIELARDMLTETERLNAELGHTLQLRIGVNTGPVTAGVIGQRKFIYDLWGDTVNVASRMESSGVVGRIQVTQAVYEALRDDCDFEPRGEITVKGKGELPVYLLARP